MKGKRGQQKFEFPVYTFTKAGRELLKAIDIEQDEDILIDYLNSIKEKYEDKIIIKVYGIIEIRGNDISYNKEIDLLHDQISTVSSEEDCR